MNKPFRIEVLVDDFEDGVRSKAWIHQTSADTFIEACHKADECGGIVRRHLDTSVSTPLYCSDFARPLYNGNR